MTMLVTGGAGYIGSHVVKLLRERGHSVLIVDNLSTGLLRRVDDPLLELDLASEGAADVLAAAMQAHRVTGVVHFAALKDVGESVAHPVRYERVNVHGLRHLLDGMRAAGVRDMVFSSSAAVYGEVAVPRVDESTPCTPANPYGASKLEGERLIGEAGRAWGLRAIALRYFNVAGTGWDDLADTGCNNLVPIVIDRATRGLDPLVYGGDHATPDGSCVRDYIHVLDLAQAHLAALDALASGRPVPPAVNLGTGQGASVIEVVDAVSKALGVPLRPRIVGRRAGDPDAVIADPTLARRSLGWRHEHDLASIVQSAVSAATVAHRDAV